MPNPPPRPTTHIPIVIETIESIPGLDRDASKDVRERAINKLAVRRDQEIKDEGIYILISKRDRVISETLVRARIANLVKSWDPSRLVDNASGWTDAGAGDVLDKHDYVGPSSPTPSQTRAAVLGEFGGLGLKLEEHLWTQKSSADEWQVDRAELNSRYVSLIQQMPALIKGSGLSAAGTSGSEGGGRRPGAMPAYGRRAKIARRGRERRG